MEPRLHDFLTREQIGRARQILDELELLLGVDVPDDGSPEAHAAAEIRSGLKLVAKEIGDRMRGIENNRDLSNQGRAKAFANLAASMRPRLQGLEKGILPRLQAKLDALRAELAAPLPGLSKDDAVAAVRQWEIRGRLSALDDASRIAALWSAVEHGDGETLHAFTTAPQSFPLVDSEVLSQAMSTYWERQKPDTMAAIEATESMIEMLSGYFRRLTHVCDNLAGIVADDPVESVNAGADNSNE